MSRKMIYSFITLILCILVLAACSNKQTKDDKQNESPTSQTESKNITSTGDNKDALSTNGIEDVANTVETVSEETKSEETGTKEKESQIDVSLKDRLLLTSIKLQLPESYKMTAEEKAADGTISTTVTYQKGYSTRTEKTDADKVYITIFNADDGITYEYYEGESTGYIDENPEAAKETIDEMNASTELNLLELLEQQLSEFDVVASMDKYLGRKVVYIELSEPEGANVENETATGEAAFIPKWQMWYDAEYAVALKYNIDLSEEWKLYSEAKEIEFNLKLDNALFEKPEGITFN